MTKNKKDTRRLRYKDIKNKFKHLISQSRLTRSQYRHILISVFFLSFFIFSFSFFILKDLPSPKKLAEPVYPVSTKIFDRHGELLYEIYNEKKRTPIKLEDVPQDLINATIAIEDKDFFKHRGFSARGILRSLYTTAFKHQLQGGSTITQQLVKNALLTQERTIKRKIREALLAFATEILYSKEQILEMYFNQVPYGGATYGIEAAAEKYFNKKVNELNLAESALLAGLPAAPTKYSPFGAHPERANERQKEVLRRMVEDKYLSEEQRLETREQKLELAEPAENIRAPHFVMYVKDLLIEKYGSRAVEQGGLRVTTSLDLKIQEFAQETVTKEIADLKDLQVGNGAALVTNPSTSEVLAMVGSKDYFNLEEDGNVNVTLSSRQPGSAIKPINYAVGLMRGYTLSTVFVDIPTCFSVEHQPLYCPTNYDGQFRGAIQMRFALGSSVNIPAVKMLALNGLESMIATASAMGITTFQDPANYGLSLTLGGGEVKMIDLAVAFGVFANNGLKVDLHPILKVEDYQGKILEEFKPEEALEERVLPMEVAFLISHILLDNNARIPAFGTDSLLKIPNHPEVSVKTGTTDDKRDNWTIGFTPDLLVAVWVGNNDNSPMSWVASGITGASPIWHEIMAHFLENKEQHWPIKPTNVIGRHVCAISGLLPGDSGCQTRFEYFIQGKTPAEIEVPRRPILIDQATQAPAPPGQTEGVEIQEHSVVIDQTGTVFCFDCAKPHPQNLVINPQSLQ